MSVEFEECWLCCGYEMDCEQCQGFGFLEVTEEVVLADLEEVDDAGQAA